MNLDKLAKKYKSDKYGSHFYTPIYQKYMESKKNKKMINNLCLLLIITIKH